MASGYCLANVHNVHKVHRLWVADTRSVDFRELGTSGGLAESEIMNDHEGGPADDGQGAATSSACGLVLEVDR